MAFNKKLLDVLACPVCKGKLKYHDESNQLVCTFDRLLYPINDDIPVLLENEATHVSSEAIDDLGLAK